MGLPGGKGGVDAGAGTVEKIKIVFYIINPVKIIMVFLVTRHYA